MQTRSLLRRFIVGLVVLAQVALCHAQSAAPSLCVAKGYTIGYFNGVFNTLLQAQIGRDAVKALVSNPFNNEPVQAEVFYNSSGNAPGSGATSLQDLAETFIQRANEIDQSGELSTRWEFFWENVSGERSFTDALIDLLPSAAATLRALASDLLSKIVAGYASLLSSPPTSQNYAEHNARLDTYAVQKQKLLLVAHSQGNLFVNQAYDHIVAAATPDTVKVVHVAPASPTLRGDYTLNSNDAIINGLRIQGFQTIPANNVTIPFSTDDPTGHFLTETYLDPSRPGYGQVKNNVTSAMSALKLPDTAGGASVGAFTVTLTWDGAGDVDLHTSEPGGSHVFYGNTVGAVGHLDVDNVIANGPEHYYASCEPEKLQTGGYRIGINNYRGATGRTATVQVATALDGVISTKSLGVGPERGTGGDGSPIGVVTVNVAKDPTTGAFKFTAQ